MSMINACIACIACIACVACVACIACVACLRACGRTLGRFEILADQLNRHWISRNWLPGIPKKRLTECLHRFDR